MLESDWEGYATLFVNARTTDELMKEIKKVTDLLHINMEAPARVVYGRDTRPSSESLTTCLEEGFVAMGADGRNVGVVTTPILHYFVRCINTKGSMEEYGVDSEEGYYTKMGTSFKSLMVRQGFCIPSASAAESRTLIRNTNPIRRISLSTVRTESVP